MAQDFYIDPATNDWALTGGTTIRMCESFEELTRQRLQITLSMFRGEWFADTNFGVPYFQSVFGKNTLFEVDAIIKSQIRSVEGVIKILEFNSSLDKQIRKYTATFSVLSDQGTIENIEVSL